MVRIISYAMIPLIISTLFFIPKIGLYGIEIFKSGGDIINAGVTTNMFYYHFSLALESILRIWTLVLLIIGIAEVQKFSIGKALLNLFLILLMFIIPGVIEGLVSEL